MVPLRLVPGFFNTFLFGAVSFRLGLGAWCSRSLRLAQGGEQGTTHLSTRASGDGRSITLGLSLLFLLLP